MTRTRLALAIAGCFSCAAVAAPPILPLQVEVTNDVVPVEVSNADPIPVIGATPSSSIAIPLSFNLNEAYVVPDGQMLVLQMVSAKQTCPTIASNMVEAFVLPPGGDRYTISIPLTFGFDNGNQSKIYGATQLLSAYLAPGTKLGLLSNAIGNCDGGTTSARMVGYLMPL